MSDPIHDSNFLPVEVTRDAVLADSSANPFKLVVDPVMRVKLRRALFELIENHDEELARYVCDALVLPSDYEPWALVVSEAMAAGLAVVAMWLRRALAETEAFERTERGSRGSVAQLMKGHMREVWTNKTKREEYAINKDFTLPAWVGGN